MKKLSDLVAFIVVFCVMILMMWCLLQVQP